MDHGQTLVQINIFHLRRHLPVMVPIDWMLTVWYLSLLGIGLWGVYIKIFPITFLKIFFVCFIWMSIPHFCTSQSADAHIGLTCLHILCWYLLQNSVYTLDAVIRHLCIRVLLSQHPTKIFCNGIYYWNYFCNNSDTQNICHCCRLITWIPAFIKTIKKCGGYQNFFFLTCKKAGTGIS